LSEYKALSGIREILLGRKAGKVGVSLLIAFTLISFYVLASYPLDFGPRVWGSPSYWADYPKSAPPSWVNFFLEEKLVEHKIVRFKEPTRIVSYADGALIV
jgi:peptide/nickel transport system permease protein